MADKPSTPAAKSYSKRPRHEVADVIMDFAKKHQARYRTTRSQRRILEDILHCRTIGMGGHTNQCDHCRHIETSYNFCRNRHCPKYQSLAKARWLLRIVGQISCRCGTYTVSLPCPMN